MPHILHHVRVSVRGLVQGTRKRLHSIKKQSCQQSAFHFKILASPTQTCGNHTRHSYTKSFKSSRIHSFCVDQLQNKEAAAHTFPTVINTTYYKNLSSIKNVQNVTHMLSMALYMQRLIEFCWTDTNRSFSVSSSSAFAVVSISLTQSLSSDRMS